MQRPTRLVRFRGVRIGFCAEKLRVVKILLYFRVHMIHLLFRFDTIIIVVLTIPSTSRLTYALYWRGFAVTVRKHNNIITVSTHTRIAKRKFVMGKIAWRWFCLKRSIASFLEEKTRDSKPRVQRQTSDDFESKLWFLNSERCEQRLNCIKKFVCFYFLPENVFVRNSRKIEKN